MFKPTEEEVKDAMSGGRPVFKEGENVEFTITEVEEKKADDGSPVYIVKTVIDNTDNAGKKYSIWCRTANKGGRATLLNLIRCFKEESEILAGVEPAMVLTGKRVKSTPKFSNGYANWYDWKVIDTTPDIGGGDESFTPDTSDIPF